MTNETFVFNFRFLKHSSIDDIVLIGQVGFNLGKVTTLRLFPTVEKTSLVTLPRSSAIQYMEFGSNVYFVPVF